MDIPLVLIQPKDPAKREGAPTLYLMAGVDAGAGWLTEANAIDFYGEKGVNVVMPMTGAYTYYADWLNPQNKPELANRKWETFLTQELPGPLEGQLKASGKRGIMGISMSATSTLFLPQHHPGLYDAVSSVSGCASTTSPMGNSAVSSALARENTTPEDMWGDLKGDYAKYYDPFVNAAKLGRDYQGKDLAIYLSSRSGFAGANDLLGSHRVGQDAEISKNLVEVGGMIEVGSNLCTHAMANRLDRLGMQNDAHFYPVGTHQWDYFRESIEDSWPTLQRGLF